MKWMRSSSGLAEVIRGEFLLVPSFLPLGNRGVDDLIQEFIGHSHAGIQYFAQSFIEPLDDAGVSINSSMLQQFLRLIGKMRKLFEFIPDFCNKLGIYYVSSITMLGGK